MSKRQPKAAPKQATEQEMQAARRKEAETRPLSGGMGRIETPRGDASPGSFDEPNEARKGRSAKE